jgi:hypothetical protein
MGQRTYWVEQGKSEKISIERATILTCSTTNTQARRAVFVYIETSFKYKKSIVHLKLLSHIIVIAVTLLSKAINIIDLYLVEYISTTKVQLEAKKQCYLFTISHSRAYKEKQSRLIFILDVLPALTIAAQLINFIAGLRYGKTSLVPNSRSHETLQMQRYSIYVLYFSGSLLTHILLQYI